MNHKSRVLGIHSMFLNQFEDGVTGKGRTPHPAPRTCTYWYSYIVYGDRSTGYDVCLLYVVILISRCQKFSSPPDMSNKSGNTSQVPFSLLIQCYTYSHLPSCYSHQKCRVSRLSHQMSQMTAHIGGSTCPCSVVMIVCGHQDRHRAPCDGRGAAH